MSLQLPHTIQVVATMCVTMTLPAVKGVVGTSMLKWVVCCRGLEQKTRHGRAALQLHRDWQWVANLHSGADAMHHPCQ